MPLDGELWLGRKEFQRTVSIVRRQDKSDLWKEVRFVVFDAPALRRRRSRSGCEFVRDAARAKRSSPTSQLHEHQPCRGLDHLRAELARVEALGGEGLMLRQPGSRYEAGRSTTLLKVKTLPRRRGDAWSATCRARAGTRAGSGALLVELADGTRFSVGTGFSDAERARPAADRQRDHVPLPGAVRRRRAAVPVVRRRRATTFDCRLPAAKPSPEKASPETPRPSADATAQPGGARRRFELSDGSSNKFWEVEVRGSEMTVSFGRIGTAGQSKTKPFASPDAAAREAAKLIDEKTGKGYREVQ